MAIIVNGINIPTNGDYIKVGNTDITKVNVVKDGVTTTVWEKISMEPITIPASEILNYIDVSGSLLKSSNNDHGDHKDAPYAESSLYGIREDSEWHSLTTTSIITPKSPYTKISCDFHKWGLANVASEIGEDRDKSRVWVNDVEITANMNYRYSISNASSIEIKCYVYTKSWEDHWKTEACCCIYNVTLS